MLRRVICSLWSWPINIWASCCTWRLQEVGILKGLNYDRNIVQFYGACIREARDPLLITEYMEGAPAFAWGQGRTATRMRTFISHSDDPGCHSSRHCQP